MRSWMVHPLENCVGFSRSRLEGLPGRSSRRRRYATDRFARFFQGLLLVAQRWIQPAVQVTSLFGGATGCLLVQHWRRHSGSGASISTVWIVSQSLCVL